MSQSFFVNKWNDMFMFSCPHILSRGPRKGQPCGSANGRIITLCEFENYNPMCFAHTNKWNAHSKYNEYLADLRTLQANRRLKHQEDEVNCATEMETCRSNLNEIGINDERRKRLQERLTHLETRLKVIQRAVDRN